jgi:Flp pilus assembly pilin Flp
LIREDSGATAVEYAFILSGIAAAIIVAVYAFGSKVNNLYSDPQTRWP